MANDDPVLPAEMPVVAVDVGNARIKFGLFRGPAARPLPEPVAALSCDGRRPELARIVPWLAEHGAAHAWWWIGTVNRPATTRLLDWIRRHRPADAITLLAAGDLPLDVRLPRPDMVGVDRLLDALAADRLRRRDRPAVVVDVGTAITVDLVSADGAFLGGAILPGIAMSARALNEFTDLLPLVEMSELGTPPPAVGQSTEAAVRSGLFWGAVGAIRALVGQTAVETGAEPDVFLTGGAGSAVAALVGPHARYVPHLTLSGIAVAAEYGQRSEAPASGSP
jgi:type III pantothenate kinase